jgi:amino acid transporter
MNPLLVIIFIVPGTLFAYDSFINATNLSETVKKKHITYAIVGGMIFIAIIYLLVTVAILSTGTLTVDDALVKLFGGNPSNPSMGFVVLKKIVQIFILISALGSINGFSLV